MLRFIDWFGGHEMSLVERGLRIVFGRYTLPEYLLAFMRRRIVCI